MPVLFLMSEARYRAVCDWFFCDVFEPGGGLGYGDGWGDMLIDRLRVGRTIVESFRCDGECGKGLVVIVISMETVVSWKSKEFSEQQP
jgi:hypothetical protein